MSLNSTPSADRVHIAFFGRRNAGKSSLVNAVTGQDLAVVSPVSGTTTDPVFKAMELLPLGPVMIIDTPGYDDEGALGELRVEKTKQILRKTDIAVIVTDAKTGIGETERELIALFEERGVPHLTIFTKSDLADCGELIGIYELAGIKALSYSIKNGSGSDEIKELLKGKISAFTGNTGVGKSSLLNSLFPGLDIETGEISRKLGRGRHTTRHSELYKVGGGYVADTPGFGTVDIERYEVVQKDALAYCFPEFEEYLTKCRFTTCSHTCEKGCAVLDAVRDGRISESRHASYVAMYNEVKDIQDWQKKQ